MKKLFFLLTFVLSLSAMPQAYAVENDIYTAYRAKMDSVFQFVDKQNIETGLLADYGFSLIDPMIYNGVPSDTNYVDMDILGLLYRGLYDSKVNANSKLNNPEEIYSNVGEHISRIIYIAYNKISPEALDKGWITFENEQIRLVPGKPSPYTKDYSFAVAPLEKEFPTNVVQMLFTKDQFYTNTGCEIVKVEVKTDEDSAFETVEMESMWQHAFQKEGEHEILFRLTFSDGKVMMSHSIVSVSSNILIPPTMNRPAGAKPVETFARIAADATQKGGIIQAIYLNKGQTGGKFIRPLIIAGDMDLSQLVGGSATVDLNTMLGIEGIGSSLDELSKIFDIIYIKYNDSTDDLFKNGLFFRKAIEKINENRFSVSDDSYVIGLGVGGVIARIGLNTMEKTGEDHKVQKFIAINSPFRGMNIPVSLQLMIRQIYSVGDALGSMAPEVKRTVQKYVDFLNEKAVQQLLCYYVNDGLSVDNTEHNQFLNTELINKNPTQCESVAITNGGLFSPIADSFLFQLRAKGKDNIFWVIARAKFDIRIDGYMMPFDAGKYIYDSDVRVYLRIFLKNKDLYRQSFQLHSESGMYPLDGMAGVRVPRISTPEMSYVGSISTLRDFCLIPTPSSLDIDFNEYIGVDSYSELAAHVPFDRYYQASSATYGDMSGLVRYLEKELVPHIEGGLTNVLGATELEVVNVPNIPLIKYTWNFDNKKFKVVSQKGTTATICPLVYDGKQDMVSVTPSLIIPVEGLDFSGLSTPKEYLYSQKIDIAGDKGITSDDKYYELSAVPGDVESVEWTASEGVVLEYVDALSVKAHVDSVLVEPWIEASMTSCGVKHTFRKNLNSAMLSGAVVASCESWISQQDHKRKYFIHIDVKPSYLSIEDLYFCWTNDVQVRKENPDEDDKAVVQAFGQARITTAGAGDVGICRAETAVIDKPIVPDSTLIRWPPRGINPLAADVTPVEPGPDPIPLDREPLGANEALVVMPSVSAGEIASGNVTCSISDSFGNKIELKIPVSASWDVVRHASYQASPNPASSTLRIQKQSEEGELSVMSTGNRQITAAIFDSQGLVKTEELESGNDQWQMEVGDLPDGTYYLNVLENGEVVDRQIILIQH